MFVLDGKVLREQVVRAPDDELRDLLAEFFELLLACGFVGVRGVRVAAADDGVLEVLAKFILRPEEVRIGEAEK